IGNFDRDAGEEFLNETREILQPGDALLLGTDLEKSVELQILAYDDPAGVTAAFNLNLLVRINRELGADFDLRCFRHEARWNSVAGRWIQMLSGWEDARERYPQPIHSRGSRRPKRLTSPRAAKRCARTVRHRLAAS